MLQQALSKHNYVLQTGNERFLLYVQHHGPRSTQGSNLYVICLIMSTFMYDHSTFTHAAAKMKGGNLDHQDQFPCERVNIQAISFDARDTNKISQFHNCRSNCFSRNPRMASGFGYTDYRNNVVADGYTMLEKYLNSIC